MKLWKLEQSQNGYTREPKGKREPSCDGFEDRRRQPLLRRELVRYRVWGKRIAINGKLGSR